MIIRASTSTALEIEMCDVAGQVLRRAAVEFAVDLESVDGEMTAS